jgi:hypothetical protein
VELWARQIQPVKPAAEALIAAEIVDDGFYFSHMT